MRLLIAIALPFAVIASFTTTAQARTHCWCEVATGCPKTGGKTVHDLGAIASYPLLRSGKQRDCATRCGQEAAAIEAQLRDDPDALCERLGPGTHHLAAYSRVGHTDVRNNWCDPDHVIGTLTCRKDCVCPEGYTYDEGAGHCAGYCNGLFVMTRPDSCDMVGQWADEAPCDGDGQNGWVEVGEWSGTVPVEAGGEIGAQVDGGVWVEDLLGDVHAGELPSELPLDDIEADGGDGGWACGVDICAE